MRIFKSFVNKWFDKYVDESDLSAINKDLYTLGYTIKSSLDRKNDNADYETSEDYYDVYKLGNNTMFGQEHIVMYSYELDDLFDSDMIEE